MKCPSCGENASGNFCSECGSSLVVERCSSCGAETLLESKFCNGCGKPTKPKQQRTEGKKGVVPGVPAGNSTLAWWVAGVLLVVTLGALGYPALSRNSNSPAAGGGAGMGGGMGSGGGSAPAVDLTAMSPEAQATLLFNRVMTSDGNGDSADVAFFLPMALGVHEQLNPTDPDGLYHFALLHLVGEDYEAALTKAEQGLSQVQDFILLLAVSAEASLAMGDTVVATEFYAHFLEVYDQEMDLLRPGYDHHQRILPVYREEAQAFMNQR